MINSHSLTVCMLGDFSSFWLFSSADFYQNKIFKKKISVTLSESEMVWIQIRTDPINERVTIVNYMYTTSSNAEMLHPPKSPCFQ